VLFRFFQLVLETRRHLAPLSKYRAS